MKVKIKLECEFDVSGWYEDERLTKKEKLRKLNEDFNDIEVFIGHIGHKEIEGNVVVSEIK